ncbi:hypothetical protein JDN40_10815 [Rhodomicrobium vannielii ATCC 17100]|nr:hypothetical protein [Rhodomicrobium vannielii]MBJ7534596.1 hypothetical protein [Rhodomicrobium vannielii ATCC 17100]
MAKSEVLVAVTACAGSSSHSYQTERAAIQTGSTWTEQVNLIDPYFEDVE